MFVTLMYHSIDSRIDDPLAVPEKTFEAQLAHIRDEGYSVLTLADVLQIASGARAPERSLFFTFDDGYVDNLYRALPRLEEYGVEATLFVPTAYIGASNGWNSRAQSEVCHLNWSELEQWLDRGGRIGGHTHERLSSREVRPDELSASIELNRRLLEQRLGTEIVAFAYPYGVAIPAARAQVARRYEVAWVVRGGTWDPRRDRFSLNRLWVDPRMDLVDFGRNLDVLFETLATGRAWLHRLSWRPRERPPAVPKGVDPPPPRGPRVALIVGGEEESLEYHPELRFADLLDAGWDVHLLHRRGGMFTLPGLDELPDELLQRRVHPPPLRLHRRGPRVELLAGLFGALLRHPVRTFLQLAAPADRGTRYLRATLLALNPDLIDLPAGEEACDWAGLTAAVDARLVIGVVSPAADHSLLHWELPGHARDSARFHVLAVGPFSWTQGFEHALQAIRLLADRGLSCEFRIVGSGDYEDELAFARHDLGLGDAVELFSPDGRTELLEHLRWADVVVNPAVVPTRPSWLLDALAAGRPLVTTELPPGSDEPALVVPRRDAEALADALARLATDPALARRFAEAGRRRARELPRRDDQLARFRELYRTTLDA